MWAGLVTSDLQPLEYSRSDSVSVLSLGLKSFTWASLSLFRHLATTMRATQASCLEGEILCGRETSHAADTILDHSARGTHQLVRPDQPP